MTNKAVCKNKGAAISILETITEYISSDTQRAALEAVAEWIKLRDFGSIPEDPDKRRALAHILWTNIKSSQRDHMSDAERRAEAAFFLEGIEAEAKKRKKKEAKVDV